MKTWDARLSEDGDRVLCGWTVNGRANCSGTIGWPVEVGGVRMVDFQPFYVQGPPKAPGEPLVLRITAPAHDALRKTALPLPGQRNKMIVRKLFDLPALAPCPRNRLHGTSRVDLRILTAALLPKV